MNQNHTPGPWTFHGDGMERMRDDGKTPARSLSIYSGNVETGENLSEVAEVCIPMGENWGHEETKANARLIAAAPDLLDALERLFEHTAMVHNRWGEDSNTKEADLAIRDARTAIAKARGAS